jgi:hypothetical protein
VCRNALIIELGIQISLRPEHVHGVDAHPRHFIGQLLGLLLLP